MKILKLPREATVEDLYELDERAELVDGQLVLVTGAGFRPTRVAGAVYRSLWDHETRHGGGFALTEGAVFEVSLPHRESFSPDASWYIGPDTDLRIMQGAPTLAVEVRSRGDYGLRAEREMRAKSADYFAAGTSVVWDVDVREALVRVYRPSDPDNPTIFHRGEIADAEPAVPGWRMPVDDLFD
jgi:Uma2 family endonuclease